MVDDGTHAKANVLPSPSNTQPVGKHLVDRCFARGQAVSSPPVDAVAVEPIENGRADRAIAVFVRDLQVEGDPLVANANSHGLVSRAHSAAYGV